MSRAWLVVLLAALLVGQSCSLLRARPCDSSGDCAAGEVCDASTGRCAGSEGDGDGDGDGDEDADGGACADGACSTDGGAVRGDGDGDEDADGGACADGACSTDGGAVRGDGGGEGGPDAGMLDAGDPDAGVLDGGDLDAGVDAGLLDCEREVVLSHAGPELVDYAVRLEVPVFAQLATAAATLRMSTTEGAALSHWTEDASADPLVVWVRVPTVADGEEFIVSACDPAALDTSDADAVFPLYGWGADTTDWEAACMGGGGCTQTFEAAADPPRQTASIDVTGGCSGVGDFRQLHLRRNVDLAAGSYRLRVGLSGTGTSNGFSGNFTADTGLVFNMAFVNDTACNGNNTTPCTLGPAVLDEPVTVASAGSIEVLVFVSAAGCTSTHVDADLLILRKASDPEPTATVLP